MKYYKMKEGYGIHIGPDGREYTPGDIYEGIPVEGARDKFEFVGNADPRTEEEDEEDSGFDLTIVPRGKSKKYYDVVRNDTGEPVNDKALTKAEAEALVNEDPEPELPELGG